MEELESHQLDPQEGFVLSRVNGEWDIESITKICPMGEQDVRAIFQTLMDQGTHRDQGGFPRELTPGEARAKMAAFFAPAPAYRSTR